MTTTLASADKMHDHPLSAEGPERLESRIPGLCSDVTGPGSRRGPGGARIPVGYRPDAPARVGSPAEVTGAADALAGASGRSSDGADRPGIDATVSFKPLKEKGL